MRNNKLKIAIIYATHGGTVRECAKLLKKELAPHSVTLIDVNDTSASLYDFDRLVLGFSIRMGRADKRMRHYMKENKALLISKSVGYFICCGFTDCYDEYTEKVIPKELLTRACAVACLGGSLDPTRFKGFDRFVVKRVRAEILGGGENGEARDDMSLPTILDENIVQFADKLKNMR